jgi:hypothetical protein
VKSPWRPQNGLSVVFADGGGGCHSDLAIA